MVYCWSPEPPQEPGDVDSTAPAENILVYETDESDGENVVSDGYELLPLEDVPAESDDEDLEVRDIPSISAHSSSVDSRNIPSPLPPTSNLPSCDTSSEFDLPPRADIVVDSARIQAAMAQFTLPPSAIPSWASEIPESQWTHHLISRINTLQNQRN